MKRLRVDVWSDVACPWCYVGKRRLDAALAQFPHAEQVEVVFRSFELDPKGRGQREPDSGNHAEHLARKYGVTLDRAQGMIDRMVGVGQGEGLEMRFDRLRSGNTYDAHRLLHFAHTRGLQLAMKERLFKARFTEGAAIDDAETLVRLAEEVGLHAEEVRAALGSDAYAEQVRADEDQARQLGVTGVPFFVLGGKYAVSGAQPVELLVRALGRAWEESAEEEVAVPVR